MWLLGQVEAASGNPVQTILELAYKGGWLMLPIAACSLYALAVVVERWVSLGSARIAPRRVMEQVRGTLSADAENTADARRAAEGSPTPLGRLLAAALGRLGLPREQLERFLVSAAEGELRGMRKHMRGLAVVVAIAPMLGLLGTVFGMIEAFSTVATSGEALGRTELLATGIYEALVTTAAGLLVAIPAMIGYHALSGRIERRAGELNDLMIAFLTDFHREAPRAGGADGDARAAEIAPRGERDDRPLPAEMDAAAVAGANGDPPAARCAKRAAVATDAS